MAREKGNIPYPSSPLMDCTTIARKFLSLLLPLIITHHWPRFANLLSSRIGKGRFKIALSKRRLDFLGRKGEESDLIETTIALDNSTRDFPDPTILASIKESRDNGAWREILLFSGMIERIRRGEKLFRDLPPPPPPLLLPRSSIFIDCSSISRVRHPL